MNRDCSFGTSPRRPDLVDIAGPGRSDGFILADADNAPPWNIDFGATLADLWVP